MVSKAFHPPCPAGRGRSAFTLTELLVVVGIMTILLLMSITMGRDVLDSKNLTQAGELLMEECRFWQQSASVRNAITELCFIKYPATGSASAPYYNAVRTRLRKNDGSYEWLGPLRRLPVGVIMDSATSPSSISSILTTIAASSTVNESPDFAYIALAIRPSGIVEPAGTLTPASQWYVTLLRERDTGKRGNDLRDFVTIQITPTTGRVTAYRP